MIYDYFRCLAYRIVRKLFDSYRRYGDPLAVEWVAIDEFQMKENVFYLAYTRDGELCMVSYRHGSVGMEGKTTYIFGEHEITHVAEIPTDPERYMMVNHGHPFWSDARSRQSFMYCHNGEWQVGCLINNRVYSDSGSSVTYRDVAKVVPRICTP